MPAGVRIDDIVPTHLAQDAQPFNQEPRTLEDFLLVGFFTQSLV
jgi:hypothetical protein